MTDPITQWAVQHAGLELDDFVQRLIIHIGGIKYIEDCVPFVRGIIAYNAITAVSNSKEDIFEYLICTNWLASPVDNSRFTSIIVDAYYDDTPKAGYSNNDEISAIYNALQAYFSEGAVL